MKMLFVPAPRMRPLLISALCALTVCAATKAAAAADDSYSTLALDLTAPELPANLTRQIAAGATDLTDFRTKIRNAVAERLNVSANAFGFDQMLLTLANGTSMTVHDYLTAAETLQTSLGSYGASILDPVATLDVAETVLPAVLLAKQGKDILATVRTEMPAYLPPRITPTDVTAAAAQAVKESAGASLRGLYQAANDSLAPDVDPIPVPVVKPQQDLKTKTYKDWQAVYGDAATLMAEADAKFVLSGDSNQTQAEAEANATMQIFGSETIQVLKASAIVLAPKVNPTQLDASLWVAGQTLYDKAVTLPTLSLIDSADVTLINVNNTFRFAVGPIPMSARLGATGTGGLGWDFEASIMHASATLTPHLAADAYAEVGADIVIARIGVGGELKLLDATTSLTAMVDLQFDSRGNPNLVTSVSSDARLNMLEGQLYAFADVSVPVSPFEERLERDLYRWSGIAKDLGNTVSFKKTTSADGVRVAGDAEVEDYVAGDLDVYETNLATALAEDLNARTPVVQNASSAAILALNQLDSTALDLYFNHLEAWN